MLGILFLVVLILIFIIGLSLKSKLTGLKKAAGIRGKIKDQDLDGKGKRNYYNPQVGVMCKPDVLEDKRLIEYKSAHCTGNKPFPADLMQLTAEMMATGAPEAELRYGNGRSFVYRINDSVIQDTKQKVLAAFAEMRHCLATGEAPKALPSQKKCAVCSFGRECAFSMA